MKNIIAVCDREPEYACRLMENMNSKKSFILKAAAFSEEASIADYSDRNRVEVLLISENMANETTMSVKAGKKILIKEDKNSVLYPEHPSVYKYQSAKNIIKEVMSFYDAENSLFSESADWRKQKRVIGVYTPAHVPEKTLFALAMGQEMARQKAVLYINMEIFSGLSAITKREFESGLGDLIYYFKLSGAKACAKLSALTVTDSGLDMVPPVLAPDDFSEMKSIKWMELFTEIMKSTSYDVLILDMGRETGELADLLGFCSFVYIPVRDDPFSKAALYDFDQYTAAMSINGKKLRKIYLPFFEASKDVNDLSQSLSKSEIGDFVRNILKDNENDRY